ncbi:hypothetical protein Tco_0668851 [Tanacetum coccineum]
MFELKEDDELLNESRTVEASELDILWKIVDFCLETRSAVFDDDIVFDLLRFIEQQIDEFRGQDGNEEDL